MSETKTENNIETQYIKLDIDTTLMYAENILKRQMVWMKKRKYDTSHLEIKKCVKDGRGCDDIKLNEYGFELLNHKTTLSCKDFYTNPNKIKKIYYPEVENLVKNKLGASSVKCFHHQIRSSKIPNEYKKLCKNVDIGEYAPVIHCDYTMTSGYDIMEWINKNFKTGIIYIGIYCELIYSNVLIYI